MNTTKNALQRRGYRTEVIRDSRGRFEDRQFVYNVRMAFFCLFALAFAALLAPIMREEREASILSPVGDPLVKEVYAAEVKSEKEKIEDFFREVFKGDSDVAIAVCTAESGLIPWKINKWWDSDRKKGEWSVGLCQINIYAHAAKIPGKTYAEKESWLKDPVNNVMFAKIIHDDWKGFGAWTEYIHGGYRNIN